jgi:site-specific recombinase XerD
VPRRYIAAFLESRRASGKAENTLRFYAGVLGEFSEFVSDWPPTPEEIEAYLLHKRATVSEISVHTDWKALSAFLNWCERRGHLVDNPLSQVDRPRRQPSLPKAAPKATLRALFNEMATAAMGGDRLAIRDQAMFRLCYSTGLRASELARLRKDDLELEYNGLMVRDGKGGKDRAVYYANKASEALAAWLAIRPGGGWVFLSRTRRQMTRGGIYKSLQRWCQAAGVKLTVHQLRHCYATHALRAGIDLEHVQRQLGHSSITTTAIYLAADDPKRRRAHLRRGPGDDV